MDRHAIAALIPVLGMLLVLGPLAILGVSLTPLGKAIVERLRGNPKESRQRLAELQEEIGQLQEAMAHQDARIEELHDRLDFTERLLARGQPAQDEVITPV